MATINSYGSLKSAVQTWMNRKDSASVNAIPLCIGFAEQDFYRTFLLPIMEEKYNKDVNFTLPDFSGNEIQIPTDSYEIKHLQINNRPYSRTNLETFSRIQNNDVVTTSPVVNVTASMFSQGSVESNYYFTRIKDKIRVTPDLVAGDKVEIVYYKNFTPMENDVDYPECLQIGPDVMLYLSLRHAALFLRDNEMQQFWEQKAEQAGQRLLAKIDEIEWSGSSIVVPGFKA